MPEKSAQLSTGVVSDYRWMSSKIGLDELLALCPQIVTGKHVAITAMDSGPFHPNYQQRAGGWTLDGGIAYSPVIRNAAELPMEGYDEWYIFSAPTKIGELVRADEKNVFETGVERGSVHAFVNFGIGFADPGFDGIGELFWQQLFMIRPDTYISENRCCNFATRSPSLFDAISTACAKVLRNRR